MANGQDNSTPVVSTPGYWDNLQAIIAGLTGAALDAYKINVAANRSTPGYTYGQTGQMIPANNTASQVSLLSGGIGTFLIIGLLVFGAIKLAGK